MELQDILHRFWSDLMSRPSGPFAFRFALQPVMAAILAVIDGMKDARAGRTPYFWTILTQPDERAGRLHEGVKATTRILLLGIAMEAMYQFKMFGIFYIGEAIVIVFVLAFLPYLLLRGPATRIARWWIARRGAAVKP